MLAALPTTVYDSILRDTGQTPGFFFARNDDRQGYLFVQGELFSRPSCQSGIHEPRIPRLPYEAPISGAGHVK